MKELTLTLPQVFWITGICLALVAATWYLEDRPGIFKKIEAKFPRLFAFQDSRPAPVGGPPRIEWGARPRDPSDFMIQRGLDALKALEMLDEDESGDMISPMDGRVLVQMVWAQMWTAWAEERREQFYDNMEQDL